MKEIKKRWRTRLATAAVIGALTILLDEAVKEQYLFNPADIFSPTLTHEKLFLTLLLTGVTLGWKR